MAAEEYLTTNEVSKKIKIPTGTLRQWRHRGFGPSSFRLGGSIRYRLSALEEWIADQERAERGRVSA
ncbi:helix-turn-helix transcriptional regulator [Candidatus Frankia nodulisporulans]|uniref:helix-turn-helix transcriptional regulator n=1 Tax=Candidatus Frankia nodulisporulans TaxID=2060052 RepID=UPI0013D329FC|nr:helix-turn-helix domain-containing protein [Candidatus Frankia nodulisporulans]